RPITPDDAALASAWAATWNIRYAMVHRDKAPATVETTLRQLLPLELIAEDESRALYRIAGDLTPPDRFAFNAAAGALVLAEGWSPPGLGEAVYAQRSEARLLLPLGPTARGIRFDLWAPEAGGEMVLWVDGRFVGRATLPTARSWVTFALPTDATRPPLSDVRLRFARLVPVADLLERGMGVPQAGPALPVSLVVRSAGQETGDFAHIYVNGVDVSPNRRGYNLVALDRADGRVLAAASFDTHADPAASRRLADWVAGLPQGAIVAVAVRDEASFNLGQAAVEALRSMGSTVDLRGRFRWGHALIGTVGAAAGSAQERVSGWQVSQVAAGLPATAPQLAAALAGVEITR
ncbi:MAG: interleukin-like EMT inducer domain-containing protein, partial [Anaerolineae bacterium]